MKTKHMNMMIFTFFTFGNWKPPIFFKSLISLFGKIWPVKNTLIGFYGRIKWIILWWNCCEIVWLPLISYCKIILHLCFNFVKHYDGGGILLLEVLWSHRQWMVSNLLLCWMGICPIGWVYVVKRHVFLILHDSIIQRTFSFFMSLQAKGLLSMTIAPSFLIYRFCL